MAGIGGLGAFIGGLGQGVDQSYINALRQQQAQQQQSQTQGDAAFGDALAQLYGTPNAPQAPQPGNPLQGLAQLGRSMFGGAPAGPTTAQPPPSPMGPLMPGQSFGPAAPPTAAGPQAAPAPTPPAGAGAGPQPGAPSPQGGMPQPGSLTLPDLVQAIQRAKPGIRGQQLAAAVNAAIPMMNVQGLQQWRQLQGALGQQRVFQGQERVDQGAQRVQQGQERIDQSKASFEERKREFDTRQASISQRFDRDIELKLQQLQSTKDRAQAAQLAIDVRKAIDAKLSAHREAIQAANAFDDTEKPKLEAQAKADAEDAQARLDAALKAQRDFAKQNASTSKSEAPRADGSKDQARSPQGDYKLGDTIVVAGKTYRYKGGDPDVQESWEEAK